MEGYKPGGVIKSIKQPYLPSMEERESVPDRRLVLERTVDDFWTTDTFDVANQIRESFIVNYSDEENFLLQKAWNWVQEGGFLEDAEMVDSELPLEVLLNTNTVFFWTGMKESLRDPGLGDFPVACKAGTDVWRNDIRDVCGEYVHRIRTVAAGEIHKKVSEYEIISITKIEEMRGPFRDLSNETIMKVKRADLITYVLLLDYYMTLVRRGKQLLEI